MTPDFPMDQALPGSPDAWFRTTLWNWRTWALLVVVTLVVGFVAILNDSLTWFVAGQSPFFNFTYGQLFFTMLLPIPGSALAWYLAAHIRLERLHWFQALALHAAGALATAYLNVGLLGLSLSFLLSENPQFAVAAGAGNVQRMDTLEPSCCCGGHTLPASSSGTG